MFFGGGGGGVIWRVPRSGKSNMHQRRQAEAHVRQHGDGPSAAPGLTRTTKLLLEDLGFRV